MHLMSTLSKGMLLSTGISAPSTSSEKWWTVGFPKAISAEYSGKHWVAARVGPSSPPPPEKAVAGRGWAKRLPRSPGRTLPENVQCTVQKMNAMCLLDSTV